MEQLIYLDNKLEYRGFWYNVGQGSAIDSLCILNIYEGECNFHIALMANETTINGVIQTSAQMIIDTLTNA